MIPAIRFLLYYSFRLHSSICQLILWYSSSLSQLQPPWFQVSVALFSFPYLYLFPRVIPQKYPHIAEWVGFFFSIELPPANTWFVFLSSEGIRKSVEPVPRQLIFILTLIATFHLFFCSYFLCIRLFACLKLKEQNIMWSTNISEAMQAAKYVCLTADDRFRRLPIIRNETMWWYDSGLWRKCFFFS